MNNLENKVKQYEGFWDEADEVSKPKSMLLPTLKGALEGVIGVGRFFLALPTFLRRREDSITAYERTGSAYIAGATSLYEKKLRAEYGEQLWNSYTEGMKRAAPLCASTLGFMPGGKNLEDSVSNRQFAAGITGLLTAEIMGVMYFGATLASISSDIKVTGLEKYVIALPFVTNGISMLYEKIRSLIKKPNVNRRPS